MGSGTSKSSNSPQPETIVQDEIEDPPTLQEDSYDEFQNNNYAKFDFGSEHSTEFFRGLTNSDFYNVAPPNTIFNDEDVPDDQPKIRINLMSVEEEEDSIGEEEVLDNVNVEEKDTAEVVHEHDSAFREEPENGEVNNAVMEVKQEEDDPQEISEAIEENQPMETREYEENIPRETTRDNNDVDTENQQRTIKQSQVEEEEEEEPPGEEEEDEAPEEPAKKNTPRTVLDIVYDESAPNDDIQPKQPQVQAVAYVEEGDEDDEKFDLTLSEDLSAYFETPYDPLSFDFSLADANLKPIREFVKKWGFFKAVPTPDILHRAQMGVRHFNVPAPRTERGYPLPFPIFMPQPPDLKSFQSIEETLNLKKAKSFNGFIKFIKHMKSVVDDDELRVRITMKWMSEHSHKIPPLGKSDKSEFAGYAQVHLFYKFCGMLNIECAVIEGKRRIYSRDPSPNPGMRAVKAVWCAIMIKGKWRFVDPSLPGLKDMKKMNDESTEPESEEAWMKAMRVKIGEFYSLPDPTHFVYTHLPDIEYWQLLCRPVRESEWYDMVCVSPFFFHHGFDLQSKVAYNVKCNGSHLIITFTYPADAMYVFTTSIVNQNPPKKKKEIKNYRHPYVSIESDFEGKTVSIEVFVMQKGTYFLHVFFRDLSCECRDYLYLCTYSLEITKPNVDIFDAFLVQNRQQWGPADDTLDAGVIPITHVTNEIECFKEILDIEFDLQNDINFHCSLTDREGTDLSRHVMYWVFGKKLNIKVTCPGFQKCALEISIKDEKGDSLKTICNYRVYFSSNCNLKPVMGFPASMTKLGLTEVGEQLKLHPLFPNPYSVTISEETTLEFRTEYSESIIFPSLKFISDKLYSTDSYMTWFFDEEEEKLSLCINPVRHGLYLLTVQNKLSINVVESTPLYFGFINVDIPSNQWSPYPDRSMEAQKLVKIVEPRTGYLCAKKEYLFSFNIYEEVHDVAILTSNGWSHLKHEPPHKWSGKVTTGPKGTDVVLNARFEVGSEKFTKLLTYKAIASEEYEGRNRRQDQVRTQRMLAFAQDEKPKPNKLSEMAERHRKEMKSKAKKDLKPRRDAQESNSDTDENTETNQYNAKNKQESNTNVRAKRKGGWGTVKKELLSKGKDEKKSEESDTAQDKKVGWNFVAKEIMSKVRDEQTAEELDIAQAKKTGGWAAIKREMISKGKDEKRRPYRGWYANRNERARKPSEEDTKSVSSSSSSSMDHTKQRRPSSEKAPDKSVEIRNSQRGTPRESTPRGTNNGKQGSLKDGNSGNQRKENQSSKMANTPRAKNTKQSAEKQGESPSNESKNEETDQVSENSTSDSVYFKDKASNESSDSAIDDEKGSHNEADETNDSLNKNNPVTDDSDFDSEEETVIEIPEPETLSPATSNRLKVKRHTFVKKRTGKVAFSTPAGMLATPRVRRT